MHTQQTSAPRPPYKGASPYPMKSTLNRGMGHWVEALDKKHQLKEFNSMDRGNDLSERMNFRPVLVLLLP